LSEFVFQCSFNFAISTQLSYLGFVVGSSRLCATLEVLLDSFFFFFFCGNELFVPIHALKWKNVPCLQFAAYRFSLFACNLRVWRLVICNPRTRYSVVTLAQLFSIDVHSLAVETSCSLHKTRQRELFTVFGILSCYMIGLISKEELIV
jgi:hypothetical protein